MGGGCVCVWGVCVCVGSVCVCVCVCVCVYARAHRCIGAVRRRTGGGGGAQQLVTRRAGADRVGRRVEPRIVAAGGVVAALRKGRHRLHESRPLGLARGGGGGAARRLGLDPHRARRALVAARGTGHVRTCARQHGTCGPRPCRSSRALLYPSGNVGVRGSTPSSTAQPTPLRRGLPSRPFSTRTR
jgi:hypothetical protein